MKDDDLLALLDAAAEPEPARILDALLPVSNAERSLLVLRDGIPVARLMDSDKVRRAHKRVSRTLLKRVRANERPIVATDADLSTTDSLQGQNVRSFCVVPLRACEGAAYLDHRYEKGLFADRSEGRLISIDEHIREMVLRFGASLELQEIADRLGLRRKTLWEKKKKWRLS